MQTLIRKASQNDIERIMEIVHGAQLSLAELGIDQWQNGYPTAEIIATDIEHGTGYVACNIEGKAIGYAAIITTGEEAYNQINSWNINTPYVVIHRLCVDLRERRTGVAQQLMEYAISQAARQGIGAMRIDTHRGNTRMQQMVEKMGFRYCGVVYYDSGERLAYDLNISLYNNR